MIDLSTKYVGLRLRTPLHCPDPSAFERAQYMRAVKGAQHVVFSGREAWKILTRS